ncbi:MAG: shikimate dehydrogenase [Pseudomonadota bacterium]|nr:shikimate dehydrogenase [Pseudomonadota bacterium]
MSLDRYAVIGNPVTHSLSPLIHRAFAKQSGELLTYSVIETPIDAFEARVAEFFDAGGCGLNVTVPFKSRACDWVDCLDEYSREAGAVNTIRVTKEGFEGFNTDGIGLMRDLERLGWSPRNARVLILGAGGAARGILGPLLRASVRAVMIANRTPEKARHLADQFEDVGWTGLDKVGGVWDIVINATSAGLDGDGAIVAQERLRNAYCYDLYYRSDGDTPFVTWAQKVALGASDGLGMLVEQAAEAFRIWRGHKPDTDLVLQRLRRHA